MPIERHISRKVIEHLPEGSRIEHPLSVVELTTTDSGEISDAHIYPFAAEQWGTTWHDTPLTLIRATDSIILDTNTPEVSH